MTGPDDDGTLIGRAVELLTQRYEESRPFNEFIDSEGSIEIGSGSYSRSRGLYWLDRGAYVAEKSAWESRESEARHERALGLIRDGALENTFADLLQAVERDRLVPFVGAGISKCMGMPLWSEALERLLARLPNADQATVQALLNQRDYLQAAQLLAEHDPFQTAAFIRTTYRSQRLRLAGPVLHLPKFAKGCVVTTNFDDALEKTYEQCQQQFQHYMHGTQEHNFFTRMVRGDRCILKLHGDAENDATHILTRQSYDDAYGTPFDFSKPLPKALRQIYVSQSLFFVGCSLDGDWTLDLMRAARESDGFQIPSHFALLPEPGDARLLQQKETDLLALNIQPFWYPADEHELVEQVFALIADVAQRRFSFTL